MYEPYESLAAKLGDLESRRTKLIDQLDKGLLLKSLFPTAFDHGSCKTTVCGNAWEPEELVFTVIRGDGSRLTRRALDVPPKLWSKTLATLANTPRLSRRHFDRYRALLAQL